MTLNELTHAEQVVLLALVGLMARMDGTLSEDERDLLEQIAEQIGPDRLAEARDAAAALSDAQAMLQAARAVERAEAREVIFELVYDIAARDTIAPDEARLLNQLAESWQLPRRLGTSA
jgi:3-polyprenyl-4-hydroxybenzoate decarboxylase